MGHSFGYFGAVMSALHVVVAGGFLYLVYDISKSLKRIVNKLEQK